jgi:hypothetical protein
VAACERVRRQLALAAVAALPGCYGSVASRVRRSRRVLGALGAAGGHRGGTVQLLADELDDDLADEIGDGAAQLVTDERLSVCSAGAATPGV